MSRKFTAADRSALIRFASTMEKGSEERRTLLAELQKRAAEPVSYDSIEVTQSPVMFVRGNYQIGRDTDSVDSRRGGISQSPQALYKELLRKWGNGLKDRTNWSSQRADVVQCHWYGGDDFDPLSRREVSEWESGSEDVYMYHYELTIKFSDGYSADRFMKENRL